MPELTHFDDVGNAHMVDVGAKSDTKRTATARGRVLLSPDAYALIADKAVAKGDVLSVAQLAGIMGAKKTPDLIPLCHPLSLSKVAVDLSLDRDRTSVEIEATVSLTGKTGVEMEALTAVSVAALTVYDMVKAVDKGMRIEDIHLVRKEGGKSGTYVADDDKEPR